MEDTKVFSSGSELQQQLAEWLRTRGHNAMITLTFSGADGVSYREAQRLFGVFAHKLKCELFGRNSKRRVEMCPIVENYGAEIMWSTCDPGQRQGTHIHCLMRLPEGSVDYKEVIQRLWRNSGAVCGDPRKNCPNSDDWFVKLDTQEKRDTMTNYALKKCTQNIDGVLIKFMPVRPSI